MNVSLKNTDATRGILTLEIVKTDYSDRVDKNLRSIRQKANLPGFRKGMVPMGMVKKLFGKSVLAEEVNKLISENISSYIRDNHLHILGEPLPNETERQEIDFDTQEEFVFNFDVAFAPEIKLELSKADKIPYYQIKNDDEMIDKQLEAYQANFGSYDEVDYVEENDLVKGTLAELENGILKEGGVVAEGAVLMPMYIKDEAEKAKLIGAKKNSVVIFNPNKAYEGAEAEIASLLKINKEDVAEHTGDFSFEIREVTRHKNTELNQELFDKVFGKDVVTSEEAFKDKIREALAEQFVPQSDYKFLLDAHDLLVQKVGELAFADDLLKRWLMFSDEKNTQEKIDEQYPQIVEDLKYQLIREKIVTDNGLKVENADLEDFAKRVAKAQFAQYGMLSVPEDVLGNYAKDMLNNKQTFQNIFNRAMEEKITEWLKGQVELEVKEVTPDDFNKLME